MPKISIIVPVYNVEDVLEKCVNSILEQTYTDFELILIDDGSKDKSGEICDSFEKKDSRVKAYHTANCGVSSARNTGIKNSNGEFITFIDSDDYVNKEFIENLLDDTYDFVCHAHTIIDEFGKIKGTNAIKNISYDRISRDDIIWLLKNGQLNGIACKLYKTQIIRKNNITFDTSINFGEDTLFSIKYLLYVKSAVFKDLSNYMRVNYTSKDTLSNVYSLERINMLKEANILICKALNDDGLLYERMIYPYSRGFNNIYKTDESFLKKWHNVKKLANDESFINTIKAYPGCCVSNFIEEAIKNRRKTKLFLIHTYLFFRVKNERN